MVRRTQPRRVDPNFLGAERGPPVLVDTKGIRLIRKDDSCGLRRAPRRHLQVVVVPNATAPEQCADQFTGTPLAKALRAPVEEAGAVAVTPLSDLAAQMMVRAPPPRPSATDPQPAGGRWRVPKRRRDVRFYRGKRCARHGAAGADETMRAQEYPVGR